MKTYMRTATLLSLLFSPLLVHAYSPPCERGDLYVGGTSYREASCIERRYLKPEKALRLQQSDVAQRKIVRPATRRTQSKKIRKVYLHPVTSRSERAGLVKERNVRIRKHSVRVQEVQQNLRPSLEERGNLPGTLRKDFRPVAKLTPRSKHIQEKRSFLKRKAMRHKMRDVLGRQAQEQ